jgi:hypothetical protein
MALLLGLVVTRDSLIRSQREEMLWVFDGLLKDTRTLVKHITSHTILKLSFRVVSPPLSISRISSQFVQYLLVDELMR